MELSEQLELLQSAEGDAAQLALLTIDLTFTDIQARERTALRAALEAAAVPHWCDTPMLSALLQAPESVASELLSRLVDLPLIEPFPARGPAAVNVHEASRLAIRAQLASRDMPLLQQLSARAASHLAGDLQPSAVIEYLYHRLVADPQHAAD